LIADIKRMPTGCGVWPALWAVGENWPFNGEVRRARFVPDLDG
jgi:beta-glucanase (GH16 family)